MPQAARVNFNVQNFTAGISTPLLGVQYVLGVTKRGPVMSPHSPEAKVNTWAQFERTFGGLLDTSDFPLLCRQALLRGATLRVCRVDTVTPSAAKAAKKLIQNAVVTPETLFEIQPKYAGVNYNKFKVITSLASNGSLDYWNLAITHSDEPALNEVYENIPKFTQGAATIQTCLNDIIASSVNFNFYYVALTAVTDLVPEPKDFGVFTGGTDSDALVDADYVAAMNTFHEVDDGMIMAVPGITTTAVNAAGALYASNRKDIVFFAEIPNNITTAADIKTERTSISSNTKYVAFFAGGLKIRHPEKLIPIDISAMGAILGIAAEVHSRYGPWYSLAGYNRGQVPDGIGVINNFGSPARFSDLNLLANAQVNMMVVKNEVVQLSGNFSGQFANDLERFLSIVFLVLWMKKVLVPVLEEYLEEPCDIITFRSIYNRLKPLLDDMTSPSKRALFKYEYYGDQAANSLDDLQVNTAVDVGNGKYKINLKIWPIPSLQELTFNLMLVIGEGVTIE